MQEFRADAVVEPDAARHLLHIGADLLAQIGDLVDEGDLGREKGVARVFDELGRAARGDHHRRLVEEERPVELGHHGARACVLGADDDAVRPLEIADRRTLAQEFGIGDDREFRVRPRLAHDALDLIAGADRHGRFGDHDGVAVERVGDLARCLIDIGEVGMAVAAARWRPDRDEDRIRLAHRLAQILGEGEPSRLDIVGDELGEAGLEDRHLAPLQGRDLARVLVDAGDHMAEIGKAGPRHEADIARSDHRDAHAVPSGYRISSVNS